MILKRSVSLLSLIFLTASMVQAADIDTVHRKSDGSSVGGEIKSVTKTDVTVYQKVGNKETNVPANDIELIEWKDEPAVLRLARSNEKSGNLAEALTGFDEALKNLAPGADSLKADIEFLIARTAYKVAQADPSQTQTAVDKLKAFVNDHRDHYRFYDAQMLLAETALLAGDTVAADSAFNLVQQAPWKDYKMAGKLGSAETLLKGNQIGQAKAIFDQVAAEQTSNSAEKARQLQAMIGQARCLKSESQTDEAATALQQVIDQTEANDTRLLAEAYLHLGDCYAADGQQLKDAVLAYLHVDVIPTLAAHSDLHAEALYHLARLWPAVGDPARGAEASAKLEQDYPNSEWTKKLTAGS
ncbi:MAG: tetratricopeptide repeat protein [Planctomycetaceae bacterium]|nr:tetratricopeptide repeat protein [Planctomycetaceae bacterium]